MLAVWLFLFFILRGGGGGVQFYICVLCDLAFELKLEVKIEAGDDFVLKQT